MPRPKAEEDKPTVIGQIMSSTVDENGVMVNRYVTEMSDGTFVYGEDDTMPNNEKTQLENVAASQRRRIEDK